MENNNDIGALFRKKLEQLDKSPADPVWEAIRADLDKKRKRRLLYFYFPLGIAAVIALVLALKYSGPADGSANQLKNNHLGAEVASGQSDSAWQSDTVYKKGQLRRTKTVITKKLIRSNDSVREYEVVARYKIYVRKTRSSVVAGKMRIPSKKGKVKSISKISGKSGLKIKKAAILRKSLRKAKNTRNHQVAVSGKSKRAKSMRRGNRPIRAAKDKILPENDSLLDGQIPKKKTDPENKDTLALASQAIQSPKATDSIAKKKKLPKQRPVVPEPDEKKSDVYLTAFWGPNYYTSLEKASPLAEGDYKGKTRISSAFGIYARVMLGEKTGVRLGLIETTNAFTTTIYPDDNGFYSLDDFHIENNPQAQSFNGHFSGTKKAELVQKAQYLQIPAEFYYIISDKGKIGIDGFAGISAYIFQKSEVTAKARGKSSLDLGEATNLTGIFTGVNLGMTLNYKLLPKLQLDLSPVAQYQFNSFSQYSAFRPLTLSLRLGLTYKL